MIKQRKARVAVVAAAWLALLVGGLPTFAHADSIAQSILEITDFTVVASDPASVGSVTVANSGAVLANFNGSTDSDFQPGTPGGVTLQVCEGPDCGAYVPGTELGSPPVNDFSGSTATLTGSAIAPGGADALTDNTVSLESAGFGLAQSNLGLVSNFTIIITGSTTLNFTFSADPYLITSIVAPQVGSANAQIAWSLTLAGPASALWAPDGIAGNALGAITDTSDPCSLNTNVGSLGAGTQTSIYDPVCAGSFSATTALLGPGTYTLTITHTGNANAITEVPVVPAPSSLLTLGFGLVAAGWLKRRMFRRA